MGKSTISMAIFNCYVSSPKGIVTSLCFSYFPRARTSTSSWSKPFFAASTARWCGEKKLTPPQHIVCRKESLLQHLFLEISMEYSYSAVPLIPPGSSITEMWSTWWFLQNKPSGLSVALNAPDSMSRVTWHWLQPTGWKSLIQWSQWVLLGGGLTMFNPTLS